MRRKMHVESLEDRVVLTLTAYDQLMLELLNRARMDPAAEVARNSDVSNINTGLDSGAISLSAKQPLAFNNLLLSSTMLHTDAMRIEEFFSHRGSDGKRGVDDRDNNGNLIREGRIRSQGYDYTNAAENLVQVPYFHPTLNNAQSHPLFPDGSAPRTRAEAVADLHDVLFASPTHRTNMMDSAFREIGINSQEFQGPWVIHGGLTVGLATQNFGVRATTPILTGVTLRDGDNDNFYDVGEGLGGVSIVAYQDGVEMARTSSLSTGGYALALASGDYTIEASGQGIQAIRQISVGANNVKVDFDANDPILNAPVVSLTQGTQGTAGQAVSMQVRFVDADAGDSHSATIDWGDGVTTSHANVGSPLVVRHAYAAAGNYTIRATVSDGLASGSAITTATIRPPVDPGTIRGVVFDDENRDKSQDAGEQPLAGWELYFDTDGSGDHDVGEPTAISDANGVYQFSNVAPGEFFIRIVSNEPGFESAPAFVTGTVRSNETVEIDFPRWRIPVAETGSIQGIVFDDLNRTKGRDVGESGLAGWELYLDSNQDGSFDEGEPTVTSDANGQFEFNSVPVGSFQIRVRIDQDGWLSAPTFVDGNVSANETVSRDFARWRENVTGRIQGDVFADENRSLSRDAGEIGLAGWELFLDISGDGRFQSDEPTAITDESGRFEFDGVPTGSLRIHVRVPKTGWYEYRSFFGVTVPSNGVATVNVPRWPIDGAALIPYHNLANRFDVSADGTVNPVDALRVVNELNDRMASEAFTGFLDPFAANVDDFLDVNGDGVVSPVDALDVINQLSASNRFVAQDVVLSTFRLEPVEPAMRQEEEAWDLWDGLFGQTLGEDRS